MTNENPETIHQILIQNGSFPEQISDRIENGDTIEFLIDQTDEDFDIFQVYKDDDHFYRIDHGLALFNINKSTSTNQRRLLLSFVLNKSEIDLYFCIIPSSKQDDQCREYSRENCEQNRLILHKTDLKISLNDNKESQKIVLHQGDTIEFNWTTKRQGGYRIEEKKYCPISGGLYRIEQTTTTNPSTMKGIFKKTFQDFQTSFFFRLTETNQIHDIIVCIIKDKYRFQIIEIFDTNIQPNVIQIEQDDYVQFQWQTKQNQTFTQIHAFNTDKETQQSIELKIEGEHFFWPYEPSTCGCYIYQFKDVGIFCFKTATNQIGTIIVQPKRMIHSFPVFGEELILKMNTRDLIEFEWKMSDSPDEPILLTIDANSSVIPDIAGGLTEIFECSMHKCVKVEPFFRHHFHTCETFVLSIPQHGLYNFAYSDNREDVLLSVIVENTSTNHRVAYNEQNLFEPNTLIINRYDRVLFDSISTSLTNIFRTDEYGNHFDDKQPIFQSQINSLNYFMHQFSQIGIYYFSTDMHFYHNTDRKSSKSPPLAIVVLPDIRFHYKIIRSDDFDAESIITNMNDFVVWQFEQIIRFNIIQLRTKETLEDLIACHDRAMPGRNRQCIAVECIRPGTFFFANPEFERVTGSEQDRLITTIIIDPPFSHSCFLITNQQFIPNVLYVPQNETISWILLDNEQYHRIYVESNENKRPINENVLIDRAIEQSIPDIYHLHTFEESGQFTIRSNRFEETATVIVYPEDVVRSQKKRVKAPDLTEEIGTVSEFGTQVHLTCSDKDTTIFYTLDGSLPKRHLDNVQIYDSEEGVLFVQSGFHVLRAYASENERISSLVMTTSPTFVMENEELEKLYALRSAWKRTKVNLSASIQYPNKLYGKIDVEPKSSVDLIDHFELYVDDVAQKVNLTPTDVKFSAEGFAGGEQYEIHILAYPKEKIPDVKSISSNRRAFEIKREIQSGAPLISLAVSNEQSMIFLMWAHVGDQVSEYVVYVDNIETVTFVEKDFNDFFGVQFHGAQQRKRYLLHVEAKIKNSDEIRKSNIIAVNPPLEMPLKEQLIDRYFAYITVNAEAPPPDMRLEVIHLDRFQERRPEPQRKVESLPITNGLRNAVPTIEYKPNPNGVTLFWKKKSQAIGEFVESYQIMINGNQYGKPVSPEDDPSLQLNLTPGKYECFLNVIPKDKDQEVYQSNILSIDVPSSSDDKSDQKKRKKSADDSAHKTLQQKDIPIPELTIQSINTTSITANWTLDRPMPPNASITTYEVHVRGQNFPNKITSDQKIQQDNYTEHIWNVSNSPFDIVGISDRYEYIISIRALFAIQTSGEIKHAATTSKEVSTAKLTPLIDLIPRPELKVTRIGLQMVNVSWKYDDYVDQSPIKGYRIFLTTKYTETFPPTQHEYEVRNLKPGTTTDIQLSVACRPDFVDEKISEAVRVLCPPRPPPPIIQVIPTEIPYSIVIKWKYDRHDIDEIITFKIFLDGKLHGEIDNNERHAFLYEFHKLQPDHTYSIYVKTCQGQKKLDDNAYQCDVESNPSNELLLKCLVPPKGTPPKIERMHPNGLDIVWDPPTETGDLKVTGYQILQNGRVITELIPVTKRRASIHDLQIGNHYSLQVVPITNQSDGSLLEIGDEYDPERHSHCLPGPKLDVDFNDLVQIPSKIWVENISGHSAIVCWSSIDHSSNINTQPDSYKLYISNSKKSKNEPATIFQILKDKTNHPLRDLRAATVYEIQLEAIKRRRHPKTNDTYVVCSTTEPLTFETGAPPDVPANIYVIACTNTGVRIGFDAFIEHSAEIISLRVQCECQIARVNSKDIILDLTPDSTEFTLSNLLERTDYHVTIYAITDEYLNEIFCRDISLLPTKLKASTWLTKKTLEFTTSGCEPASQIHIQKSTIESIQLEWNLPKTYGSTKFLYQILRWKCERGGDERTMKLDCQTNSATIPGILTLGTYKIWLDAFFSIKLNLDDDNEINRKEIHLTTMETTSVKFKPPGLTERPEIYLTGYTSTTIDLTWNKPNMFSIIDHPENLNEQIKIHRHLLGYRIEINGKKYNTLTNDQYQCTLTECLPDQEYKVQLIAQTKIQNNYINDTIFSEDDIDETASKKLRVRMLKVDDLLRSFQANFEFHHTVTRVNTSEIRNEVKPLGKINVKWTVSNIKHISHYILQWHSSKDSRIQQKHFIKTEQTFTINAIDEKYFYIIELILVTLDGIKHHYEPLKMPIPGEPDAPKLWLVKTSNSSFTVEWSEPKSYGIPVIGFQLYIEGEKAGDIAQMNLRRAEIPSDLNRSYQVNVCAVTDNPQRSRSAMSQTLAVITTNRTAPPPPPPPAPPLYLHSNMMRTIPIKVESMNEDKISIDWSTFCPARELQAFYIHYTCLNNNEVQTMKVSKRHRSIILRDLKAGFTYAIMVLAIDDSGEVLYTSEKVTIQMSPPPNAPIVAIRERTNDHVTFEWRPSPSYGELTIVGYKVYLNNRLIAILSHDQLTYTLTNGSPCEEYTVYVQALSNDKNISSSMSREMKFTWPGIKPGLFRRLDDGQTGTIVVAWEHPQLEDESERLISYKIFSENVSTHAVRLHGEYDSDTYQATIYDLIKGKYRLWLEIQSEHYCVRARPITIGSGRLKNRHSYVTAKCFMKKPKRFRMPTNSSISPPIRQIQYY